MPAVTGARSEGNTERSFTQMSGVLVMTYGNFVFLWVDKCETTIFMESTSSVHQPGCELCTALPATSRYCTLRYDSHMLRI